MAKQSEVSMPLPPVREPIKSCLASQASEGLNTVGHTFTKGSKPV